jgi:NAD(P)-dependent dehydrogenase (short-subunit alcohol dehydrogenase family)
MQKVIVTGHTSGIGKAIASLLQTKDFAVEGISRANGFDVQKDIGRIIELAADADIFVNNAYAGFANVELLFKLFEKWREQEKIIINISSDSSDGIKNFVSPYAVAKAALDKAAEQLQNCKAHCRVLQIRCGYVDTPRVQDIQAPKLKPEDIANTVLWCLGAPEHVYMRTISMRHR